MLDNLHRWLILRLALVWLVLSLLIGALVHYLGHNYLTNHVVKMAQAETSSYTPDFIAYLRAPSEETFALFTRTMHALIENDHLMVVEFYGGDSRKIAEAIKPAAKAIEPQLPKHTLAFARNEGTMFEELSLDRELYLRVFVPILSPAGQKIGYMEGIYHAPGSSSGPATASSSWPAAGSTSGT